MNLGVAHIVVGDWESAIEFESAALEMYRDGDAPGADAAQAEHNLAVALAGAGHTWQAARHYVQARISYLHLGQRREAADVDMNLAAVAAATGSVHGARRRYRRAATELRRLGLWPQLARCEYNLGLTWPARFPTCSSTPTVTPRPPAPPVRTASTPIYSPT